MGSKAEPKYKVCLVGSGGIGTLASLALQESGEAHVTVVLRSNYDIIKEKGWKVDSVDHGIMESWRPNRGTYTFFVQLDNAVVRCSFLVTG
jgi:ketopantoate reductase